MKLFECSHFLFALIFLFFISCSQKENEVKEENIAYPNIILIMGDDHGWEETGYNGHPFVKTPVLDEMAASGLRLNRFYAAAPSCTPTRASIITGRHPNRSGAFYPNWSIRPEEISIAQLMKNAGYATAHFGKWHLGPVKKESPTSPGAMGFDTWLSHDNFFELNPILSRDGKAPSKIEGESSEILIDETIEFIEKKKVDKQQPFFTVIWFGSPHEPYDALEEDMALYKDLPDSLADKTVALTSIETGERVERSMRTVLQERYAEITAMDRAIGKLRLYLKENNLKDNTLLWYCGDNGTPPSGLYITPLRGQKGMLYEGGIRVPGIIEWPNVISKPRTEDMISVTTDMFATLTEIVGQPKPERPIDGVSLLSLIKGEVNSRSTPICFWNYDAGKEQEENPEPYIALELQEGTTPLVKQMNGKFTRSFTNFKHHEIRETDYLGERAIMGERFKLLIKGEKQTDKELYDMAQGPAEQNNVIEIHPQVALELEKKLVTWQSSVLNSLTGKDYESN